MDNKPLCARCANPECEYAGRDVRVFICLHEYIAPPTTRGDGLRGMDDEHLAEWIESIASCKRCPAQKDGMCPGETVVSRGSCYLHWHEWLQKEAK